MQLKSGSRQNSTERDTHPTVIVIFSNALASRFFGVEGETIIERDRCNLSCHSEHQGGVVGEFARCKIDVSCRATSIERRE
jgi:hypothetical protein